MNYQNIKVHSKSIYINPYHIISHINHIKSSINSSTKTREKSGSDILPVFPRSLCAGHRWPYRNPPPGKGLGKATGLGGSRTLGHVGSFWVGKCWKFMKLQRYSWTSCWSNAASRFCWRCDVVWFFVGQNVRHGSSPEKHLNRSPAFGKYLTFLEGKKERKKKGGKSSTCFNLHIWVSWFRHCLQHFTGNGPTETLHFFHSQGGPSLDSCPPRCCRRWCPCPWSKCRYQWNRWWESDMDASVAERITLHHLAL